jgi:hypothetical protein
MAKLCDIYRKPKFAEFTSWSFGNRLHSGFEGHYVTDGFFRTSATLENVYEQACY